jgi:DNA-binding protein YbaB
MPHGPDRDAILDPEGALEHLAQWKDGIDRLASDTQLMSDRLQELRLTATDPEGLVTVTVDASGVLLDLTLDAKLRGRDPADLARTILDTVSTARRGTAERAEQIIADTVGTESPAARALAERVGRQLRGEPATSRQDQEWMREW